jgi:hypothetical protein
MASRSYIKGELTDRPVQNNDPHSLEESTPWKSNKGVVSNDTAIHDACCAGMDDHNHITWILLGYISWK